MLNVILAFFSASTDVIKGEVKSPLTHRTEDEIFMLCRQLGGIETFIQLRISLEVVKAKSSQTVSPSKS